MSDTTNSRPSLTEQEETLLDEYGVLVRNLKDYFPTADDPEDNSEEFIKEYRLVGEGDKRFDGINDQLDKAIKRPGEFSKVLKLALGYELSRDDTSEYMLDLYNRLNKTDVSKIKAQKDVDERMNYYVFREVKLPFTVPFWNKSVVPLWSLGVVSTLVATIGWLVFRFLNNVPVVMQLGFVLLIIGVIGLALTAVTMFYLRDETVNADKYADREADLQRYREAKRRKRKGSRFKLPGFRD